MLYFSKLRIITISFIVLVLSFFALSNFFNLNSGLLKKNINLGLDLQGGSYLLLEVDNSPVITQKLQSKLIEIKRLFKDENLLVRNLNLSGSSIVFEAEEAVIDKVTN